MKKNLILRALDEAKKNKKNIEQLKNWLEKGFAILFSDIDSFDLASILSENKFPAKVKAGQVAPKDIMIEAGLTDLPAGPMISELSKLKIKAGIETGKIAIKEKSIIVGGGERISMGVASILTKLDITPFSIGFEPLIAYDTKKDVVYEKIKVDKEAMIETIKKLSKEAFNLAYNIKYLTKETITSLLIKGNQEANIILNLIK